MRGLAPDPLLRSCDEHIQAECLVELSAFCSLRYGFVFAGGSLYGFLSWAGFTDEELTAIRRFFGQ